MLASEDMWVVQIKFKLYVTCMTQVLLKIEGYRYSNGKIFRLLKLVFFTYKGAGILQTSIYITQRVLAAPTLIGTCSMNIINI